MQELATSGEIWYSSGMKAYQAVLDFADKITRAGLRQAETARDAKISVFTLAHISRQRQRASEATARRIAKVYAAATSMGVDAAFSDLFVEVDKQIRPARRRGEDGKFTKAEE
jgi:hypothetical protein